MPQYGLIVENNWFLRCAVRRRRKTKVFIGGRRSEKMAIVEREETWYWLNMGATSHIFRQSLTEGIYSVAPGCSRVWKKKKRLRDKFKPLAPFTPSHIWPTTAWSEWNRLFRKCKKWLKLSVMAIQSGKVWGRGFLKLFDQPTSTSGGVHWHLKYSLTEPLAWLWTLSLV